MMNRIPRMRPEAVCLTTVAAVFAGVLGLTGCSDPPPPPPPPPPPKKEVQKPKARPVEEIKQSLGVDARIHMDESLAHSEEAVRVAGFLLAQAMLDRDLELASRLSGTDQGLQAMFDNPGFIEQIDTVERIDLEFGRVLGEDAMLVLWEFPESLDVQMWAVAGPVPPGEQAFFWQAYESDMIEAGSADVSADSAWSFDDGTQVAFFATPAMVGMIDLLGEESFRDWTRIIEGWQEIAGQPDLEVKNIDAGADADQDADQPSGSGFGGGRPSGGGGPRGPGITPG